MYHGTITKSPKENELIKGPVFSLTFEQSKKIINYFKTMSRWNENYIADNLLLVPPDILFDSLKIFPLDFKDSDYLYSFEIFSIEDFFDSIPLKGNQVVNSLNCYSMTRDKLIYSKLLGSYTTNGLLKIAQSIGLEHENKIPVSQPMVNYIEDNKYIRAFYHLNLSKYQYFIENVRLNEYLILGSENIFSESITYMPLSYIDR